MTQKARRQLTVDEDVDRILDDIGKDGSASAYVEELVRTADREWRAALALLVAAGWTHSELLAACDVLNGYDLIRTEAALPPTAIAIELHDAQRLNDVCAKWDVDPEQWGHRVAQVRESDTEARAVLLLTREFWRHNPRVERVLWRDA